MISYEAPIYASLVFQSHGSAEGSVDIRWDGKKPLHQLLLHIPPRGRDYTPLSHQADGGVYLITSGIGV